MVWTPPQPDEVDISVFGPGVGESILVHLGNGKWLCVDSARFEKEPWPLRYLRGMGFDPSVAIETIVATHWHSDHVDGIADIVNACPNAKFVCSQALTVSEFRQVLAGQLRDSAAGLTAAHKEIRSVFQTLWERRKQNKLAPAPWHVGMSVQIVRNGGLEVWALSPSAEDVEKARREFVSLYDPLTCAIRPIKENSESVVLFIKIGGDAILLGSDLEHCASPNSGWNSVMTIPARDKIADLFKIPHHGSAGAFSQNVWDAGVQAKGLAVLTPFTKSQLPRTDQLERLKSLGREVYATSLPKPANVDDRSLQIRKLTRPRVTASSHMDAGMSLVRHRKPSGGAWRTETFGAAQRIA